MTAMSDTAAESVRVVLDYLGETASFQNYVSVVNKAQGSKTMEVSGDPVTALMASVMVKASEERGLREGDQVVYVEGEPFEAGGVDLDERWRMTSASGEERDIPAPVVSLRPQPSAPPAYYRFVIRTGGGGV